MQVILLVAAALVAQTQPPSAVNSGAIAGQVRLNDGTPAVKYQVEAMDVSNGGRAVAASVETDTSGHFRLDRVPAGRYNLRVSSNRFLLPAYYPGVWNPSAAAVVNVAPDKVLDGLILPASDAVPGAPSCNERDGQCYDFNRRIVVEGVLKELKVMNPRMRGVLTVSDAMGSRDLELSGPSAQPIIQKGFQQVKAGERVTAVLSPRLDGGAGAFLAGYVDANGIEASFWGTPANAVRSVLPSTLPPRAPAPAFAPGVPIRISFQPEKFTPFFGYLADTGAVFGDRGNGYRYGWAQRNTFSQSSKNVRVPDVRYDTFAQLQRDGIDHIWELEVPNGFYSVHIVAGDPDYLNSVYVLSVEGVTAINAIPTSAKRWVEADVRVAVADQRLTIASARGACNNKILFMEVTPVSSGPVSPEAKPPVADPSNPKLAGPNTPATPLAGNVIGGTIHTSTGAPDVGTRVSVVSVDATRGGLPAFGITKTDADGRYSLEGLPNGRYYVVVEPVTAPIYHPGVLTYADGGATIVTMAGKPVLGIDFSNQCPAGTGPKL